jgi:hypothetical protein
VAIAALSRVTRSIAIGVPSFARSAVVVDRFRTGGSLEHDEHVGVVATSPASFAGERRHRG